MKRPAARAFAWPAQRDELREEDVERQPTGNNARSACFYFVAE